MLDWQILVKLLSTCSGISVDGVSHCIEPLYRAGKRAGKYILHTLHTHQVVESFDQNLRFPIQGQHFRHVLRQTSIFRLQTVIFELLSKSFGLTLNTPLMRNLYFSTWQKIFGFHFENTSHAKP